MPGTHTRGVTLEQWLAWKAERDAAERERDAARDAARAIVTVAAPATAAEITYTEEEWQAWREEEEATAPVTAAHGGAADGSTTDRDNRRTLEEWQIWEEAEEPEAAPPAAAAAARENTTGQSVRWTAEERAVWMAMHSMQAAMLAAPPLPDGVALDVTAAPAPLPPSRNGPGPAKAPAACSEPPN